MTIELSRLIDELVSIFLDILLLELIIIIKEKRESGGMKRIFALVKLRRFQDNF